jgi:ectoine hydroxylase-related dioxygenase (phytanoyl-CoA dioxygenase family)
MKESRTGYHQNMNPEETRQLARQGYVVLENFMSPELVAGLRERVEELFEIEGENAGSEFRQEAGARRLANLVDKGDLFQRMVAMPEILERIEAVIGPDFKLSSLNARSANPHSESDQPLHADMGGIPDERGYWVCNTVWLLDDFTPENGATRVVPGTHLLRKLPQDVLPDIFAPHPDQQLILGKAGTVVVMNAHAWHGGTANRTDLPRRALHAFYCRSDKPQQQYQKQLLRPETQVSLSPALRRVLALDDPLNDKLSSETTRQSGFLK